MTVVYIEFGGGEEGADLLGSVVKGLGSIVTNDVFAEQFAIEIPRSTNYFVNQAYSFKVILKDKTGKNASLKEGSNVIKGLAVDVTGPSEVKVRF